MLLQYTLSNAPQNLPLQVYSHLANRQLPMPLSLRFNSHFPGEPGLAGVY